MRDSVKTRPITLLLAKSSNSFLDNPDESSKSTVLYIICFPHSSSDIIVDSNVASTSPPQGLCTCDSLLSQHSFSSNFLGSLSISFMSLLKWYTRNQFFTIALPKIAPLLLLFFLALIFTGIYLFFLYWSSSLECNVYESKNYVYLNAVFSAHRKLSRML